MVFTPVETARTRPSASVRARFAFHGLIGELCHEAEDNCFACEFPFAYERHSPRASLAGIAPWVATTGALRPLRGAVLAEWQPDPRLVVDFGGVRKTG
jgi:hypothetical protein